MRKFLAFLVSFLIGLLLFYWVIKWVGWEEIRKLLFTFSGYKGLAILGITLLIWLTEIWKWKFIFKSQGYDFSTSALGEISFASFAITYLFTPTALFGGEVFRVYAIRKKFALPWEKNLAAIAIEKVLSGSILLIFLICGAISFLFLADVPLKNFGIIAITLIGLLAVGLSIFYFKSFKKESILKWFFKLFRVKNNRNGQLAHDIEKETFLFFDLKKALMWQGLGFSFLKFSLMLIRCWLIIFFLGGGMNILIALPVLFSLYLSYLFPIPAGMGSLEAAQALTFGSLGLGTAAGITFSFILRGAELVAAFLGVILLIKLAIKFFMKKIEDIADKIN